MEIAASAFDECDIGMEVHEWVNVGMSEKPYFASVGIASILNSCFAVNSLCKDFATVVHSCA